MPCKHTQAFVCISKHGHILFVFVKSKVLHLLDKACTPSVCKRGHTNWRTESGSQRTHNLGIYMQGLLIRVEYSRSQSLGGLQGAATTMNRSDWRGFQEFLRFRGTVCPMTQPKSTMYTSETGSCTDVSHLLRWPEHDFHLKIIGSYIMKRTGHAMWSNCKLDKLQTEAGMCSGWTARQPHTMHHVTRQTLSKQQQTPQRPSTK